MSRRDVRIRLLDMRNHAQEAMDLCRGRTRESVRSDRVLSLALVRLTQIVGEAATRIPIEDQQKWRQIPWPRIVGARNRLVHGYQYVDFDVVWEIIQTSLPQLVSQLDQILESEKL